MKVLAAETVRALDVWDPRTWPLASPHEHRIYLDNYANEYAVVDEEDYHYFVQWCWLINKPHASRNGKKRYAVRTGPPQGSYRPKLYLHVEIMKRTGIAPPTPFHTIVDHRDGNELHCRRANLRWVTPGINRANVNGAYPQDLCDFMSSV